MSHGSLVTIRLSCKHHANKKNKNKSDIILILTSSLLTLLNKTVCLNHHLHRYPYSSASSRTSSWFFLVLPYVCPTLSTGECTLKVLSLASSSKLCSSRLQLAVLHSSANSSFFSPVADSSRVTVKVPDFSCSAYCKTLSLILKENCRLECHIAQDHSLIQSLALNGTTIR